MLEPSQTLQVVRQITHTAFHVEVQRNGENLVLMFVGMDGEVNIFPFSSQGEADLRLKLARGAAL